MKKTDALRLTLVLFAFAILYFLVAMRLFYWQVVRSEDLQKIGKLQSSDSLEVPATRGEILSSDNFPLATNKFSYLVYANPKVVEDRDEYVKKLAPVLEADEASVSAQLEKDLFWVRLAARVDEEKKQQIESLKLEGVGFQQDALRYYPEASMAAQIIGFLGKNEQGEDQGYFGLEGFYNRQLEGRAGRLYVIKDALGHNILNDVREEKKIDGRDLTLTIDRTIQYIAEKKLKEGIDKYEAEGGSVVIMEPTTGKVLGMVSYPRFDPTNYYEFPFETYSNPVVSGLYEPGSTFKVLIMAAGIDSGVVKPDTRCDICAGPVQIGEYKIKTWNDKYYPRATMTDVIVHSDNTGMVYVGKKLGHEKIISYLKRFGLDEKTGIDLQGEGTGTIRDEDSWYPIDEATVTFGQGISLTPIQLLNAVNSIANGGNLMKPYIVSKITTDEGKEIVIKPEVRRKTISETTAKVVTWIMVSAVDNGEAKWTRLKDYTVAGKTGTAQIPVAGHYDPNQTIASFVGFFPAEKPKISMLVLINKPKTSIYGSETAAPVFFNIAQEIVKYYNIPPTQ